MISLISSRRKRGVDANVVALYSNTSVQMINQHYQDMSDDHLLENTDIKARFY